MPIHNTTSLTSQLTDTTDKRFCTDAQKTIIGNTSGANTGDETAARIKTALTYQPVLVMSSQYANADTLSGATNQNEQYFATTFTIPANYITTGKVLRVTFGICSISTASPTLLLKFKAGTTTLSGMTAVAPASGTFYVGLQFLVAGTATPDNSVNVDVAALQHYLSTGFSGKWGAGGLIALKTNGTLALGLSAQWNANTAGNSALLRQMLVEDVSM